MSNTRAEKRRKAKAEAGGHIQATNGEIRAATEGLAALMDKPLPIKPAFALAQLANTLKGHVQASESVRRKLVEKYGSENKTGKGKSVQEDSENWPMFVEEYRELLELPVEVSASPVVLPAESLNGDFSIEPKHLMNLEKFVKLE